MHLNTPQLLASSGLDPNIAQEQPCRESWLFISYVQSVPERFTVRHRNKESEQGNKQIFLIAVATVYGSWLLQVGPNSAMQQHKGG